MQLVVARQDLIRLAAAAASVAVSDEKARAPVMSSVVLSADTRSLTLSATNLDQSFLGTCAATVAATGSVAVSARRFLERVKVMPDGDVKLSVKDHSLTIGAQRREHKLIGVGPSELGSPAHHAGEQIGTASPSMLVGLIHQVRYALLDDFTQPQKFCALLEVNDGTVQIVSTNGHQLAFCRAQSDYVCSHLAVMIPLPALSQLEAALSDVDEPVRLSVSGAWLWVGWGALDGCDSICFGTKTVDASAYLPYRSILDQEPTNRVELPRAAFMDALRSAILAGEKDVWATYLEFCDGALRIHAASKEGSASDTIDGVASDEAVKIKFNAKILLETILSVRQDTFSFGFTGPMSPTFVCADGFKAVVMPMVS